MSLMLHDWISGMLCIKTTLVDYHPFNRLRKNQAALIENGFG